MRFNFNLEDIKYIKIICKDSNENSTTIKAGIKYFNDREILACAKFSTDLEHITAQEVTLKIVCSDGLYQTKTQLKKIEKETPYFLLILQTPNGVEYNQNREFFRVPIEYGCICQTKNEQNIEEYSGKTVNISANGICAKFKTPFLTTKKVDLRLLVENKVIEVNAKYIRNEILENGFCLISFSFIKISNQDRDYISRICIQKQLEQKRNALY